MARAEHIKRMRLALRLAARGYGMNSPNPMVGAVLVKSGEIIGRGWHHRAGEPHAEIEALREAQRRAHNPKGATLYVTLEPCCTHGRTPPCTDAIIAAGIGTVVVATTDPNPKHCSKGLRILERSGIRVIRGVAADESEKLNEAFNHWIVHRTPFVTVKAAMTLDGKIATASGESKWITSEKARAHGMELRRGCDAILVGINTILADDPSLTVRPTANRSPRRIVLDSLARTPLISKVVSDSRAGLTTIVVSRSAPQRRVRALSKRVRLVVAPSSPRNRQNHSLDHQRPTIDLRWLLRTLGSEDVTSLLVEGGGEVNASFLLHELAQRVAFFYAPLVLGGKTSHKAVAGLGATCKSETLNLHEVQWQTIGPDLLLRAQASWSS